MLGYVWLSGSLVLIFKSVRKVIILISEVSKEVLWVKWGFGVFDCAFLVFLVDFFEDHDRSTSKDRVWLLRSSRSFLFFDLFETKIKALFLFTTILSNIMINFWRPWRDFLKISEGLFKIDISTHFLNQDLIFSFFRRETFYFLIR